MLIRSFSPVFLVLAIGFVPSPCRAQAELVEQQRFPGPYHPANPNNDPRVGRSDLDGDTFVIGAAKMALGTGASTMTEVGASYVFTRPGPGRPWSLQAELRPSDPAAGLFFGIGVALDGDTVAVGAIGAVYVFERASGVWTQTKKLRRSALSRSFGLDGDLLAIGEWDANVAGNAYAGEVAVYRRRGTAWSFETALRDPSPSTQDSLGKHVDVSGDRIVAYSADHAGGFSDPHAFVFLRDASGAWRLETRLRPDWGSGVLPHFFRLSSVDVSGDTILFQGGSRAALFELGPGGWSQVQVIDKRTWGFDAGDFYQDLEGDRFVVSSSRRLYDGPGHVTLAFRRVGGRWVKQAVLSQVDGYGLAEPQIDGDTVVMTRPDALTPCVVGSPPTCGLGATYVYSLADVPVGYGAGCGGATLAPFGVDAVPDFSLLGAPTSGGRLEFCVENAAPGSSAFVLLGARPAAVPVGGGCLLQVDGMHGAIGPLILSGSSNSPSGSGEVHIVVTVPPVVPGRFTAQGVVVDPASPNGVFTVTRATDVTLR